MTKRVAVYARYSSDLQKATSIEDQVAMAERFCAREGWDLVKVFADHEMSGRDTRRPGFQAMKLAANNNAFDVVVVEDIDRLTRKVKDALSIYDLLTFQNISLHAIKEGPQDFLKVLFGGFGAQMFSQKISEHTRRGMQGAVTCQRLHTSAYGYRRKDVDTGLNREIDPDPARIVRRIFEEFASGRSSMAIAAGLNADRIPAAKGGSWDGSSIRGNIGRSEGILRNPLYIGLARICRHTRSYHPETGAKKIRATPEDLVEQEIPELRIIEQPVWDAVQAELARRAAAMPRAARAARRKTYLLSGLLVCGCCGAPYVLASRTSYYCGEARKTACSNRVGISRRRIETRVFGALRQAFRSPDLIAAFEAARAEEQAKLTDGRLDAERDRLGATLAKAEAGRTNILDAIADGAPYAAFRARSEALEVEIRDLTSRIATLDAQIAEGAAVAEDARTVYERVLQEMDTLLSDPELVDEAHSYLAVLIERITLTPDATAQHGIAATLTLANGVLPGRSTGDTGGTIEVAC